MIRNRPEVTVDYIRSILGYDPDTGVLVWNIRRRGRIPLNGRAGTPDGKGHLMVIIDQKRYMVHRVIWFHVYGVWPPNEVDHINGNGLDNRLKNLRLAVRWQNRANQKIRSDNRSGFKGVKRKGKKWSARIRKYGKEYCRFGFETPEEAHLAYLEMAKELFGEYARAA